MAEGWTPWLALAGLGMFHGVNPAMGWLFAVALGMHRKSRAVVWLALLPIALGHALSVLLVVVAVVLLGRVADLGWLGPALGAVLIGWAAWHWRYGHRHRVRVGMTTGMAGLALWSFLMATAHGAGLMLVPIVLPMQQAAAGHAAHAGAAAALPLEAVGVHSAAMLLTTGAIAAAVYEWFGLGFLRRGWINLDLLWVCALGLAGLLLIARAF